MTNKALKDWGTVISALGNGIQTILIRGGKIITEEFGRFRIAYDEFALYPTYNHLKENIKKQYHNLFEETHTSRPVGGVKIEYLARCEEIIEIDHLEKLNGLSNYYVWTEEHASRYFEIKGRKLYVLILRIYKLPTPKILEESRPMVWVTLPYSLSLQDCTPVLGKEEFERVKSEIKRILEETPPTPLPQLEITCPRSVNVGEEVTIRITVHGNSVERANIIVNDNSIGMTNMNGELTHVFNEAGSFSVKALKEGYLSASTTTKVQIVGMHGDAKDKIEELGKILGWHSEKEYNDRGVLIDVVWKERGDFPKIDKAFEIQHRGELKSALVNLQHASDWGRDTDLFLVITEGSDKRKAERLLESDPYLSGAFHKIRKQTVVLTYYDFLELYNEIKNREELIKKFVKHS